MAFADQDL